MYCTLDLQDGFLHVPIEEDSIKYTAFVVPDGHYEFLKAPFGFCNSPAVFQRHIRAIFRDLVAEKVVLLYLDDLIIPAKDEKECLEKLELVLNVAMSYGLQMNWKKCEFLVRRVEYLGYIIEAGLIRPSEKKTQAVAGFPKPTSIKKVQSFLGLTGYFRKFIKDFAEIARPLTELLKKDAKFDFGQAEKLSFQRLKEALIDGPVLKLYNPDAETEVHTDASIYGLGAILMQKDSEDGMFHPIYYASWKTTPSEQKYTSYEFETLAVVKAFKKFRVYLLGIPIKIVTDCQAFAMTMCKKNTCIRVAHWALIIGEYQYTVEHRPGRSMRHADALSRNPVSVFVVEEKDTLYARIQRAQEEDPELLKLLESNDPEIKKSLVTRKGVLYFETEGHILMVVPRSMQLEIIRNAHERGHFGWKKTEYVISQEFWFPKMRKKIQNFIVNCVRCILAERKRGKTEGFLTPINKGDTPLDMYHVDHLGPMPSTKKMYNHLFAVVDSFTKFIWLYPTKSTTAEEVITRLKTQAVTFGNPRKIISDRGSAFTSKIFKEYCDEQGIELGLVTTGVSRGNGQVERINEVIIPVLTKMSMPKPAEWHKYVGSVQQYINSSFNRSIGRSPFELMIGKSMSLKDDTRLKEAIDEEIARLYDDQRLTLRQEASVNIQKVQAENIKTYNKKCKAATSYKVGDLVAVQRTQFGAGLKFCSKFLGPYQIDSVLRNNRYIVEKVGNHEGPNKTSTSADHMKPWSSTISFDFQPDLTLSDSDGSESEEMQ